uniref:7TM GPCR serpentine receptor class x (Srx) domain-containing protein n=1 Tax=Romanomermis culicivorax TaxID=13658 RepID=A0A915KPF5_ROMCU
MGFADMIQLATNGFYCTFRCLFPGVQPPIFLDVIIIMPLTSCWFAYTMIAQTMAFNRFYSLWFISSAERVFSLRNTYVILGACWLYGVCHGVVRSTPWVHLFYDPNTYSILYDQRPGSKVALKVNGILNYVHSALILFWYILICLKVLIE